MSQLISKINHLKNNDELSQKINQKLQTFEYFKTSASNEELFSELCFCILTANCQAKTCITIQNTFDGSFSYASEEQIKTHLINNHYRFPNTRSRFISKAQSHKENLREVLQKHSGGKRRNWFVKNIKGLGMKEASHFLRNIGYKNYAIIDTHILNLLQNHEIIKKPKTITKQNYLFIEKSLGKLAKQTDLDLAALDLYLWYLQTGMILK